MKKVIALLLAALTMAFIFCSCRTLEDTRPKNETANPNCVWFLR